MSELIMPFWLGYERSYAWPRYQPPVPNPPEYDPPEYQPTDPAALAPTLSQLYAKLQPNRNEPARFQAVTLAFANLFPQSTIMHSYLLTSNCENDIQAGIRWLQARGIKVLLSVVATPYPFVSWQNIYDPGQFAAFFKKEYVEMTEDQNGNPIGWGFDGININNEDTFANEPGDQYDFQPDWTMVEVIKALRQTLGHSGPDRKAYITYNSHLFDRDQQVLRQTAAELDWVNLMAYYRTFGDYKDLFDKYAQVMGAQKLFLGIGCVVADKQRTPLEDVDKLCKYPLTGKKGVMLWNASQDIAGSQNNGGKRWEYTEKIMENLP